MKINPYPAPNTTSTKIILEQLNDLWALYNILEPGDYCTARTSRKIKKDSTSGNVIISLVKFTLKIQIVKVEYAVEDTEIRINGKALTSSDNIRAGQFHTLQLGVNDSVLVEKNEWNYHCLRIIREATQSGQKHSGADSAAILMDSNNVKLYLMSEEHVKPCGSCSRSKAGKNNQKLYEAILMMMVNSFEIEKLKCAIIASTRQSEAQDLLNWLLDTTSKTSVKQEKLIAYRTKVQGRKKIFVTGACAGVDKQHLKDLILQNEAKVGETKAAVELQILDEFKKARDEDRGVYGLGDVIAADEHGAIIKLIINENLFKGFASGLPEGVDPILCRRYLSSLAQKVERNAGQANAVCIINSLSLAFEDIRSLADIAAVLKYTIPELEPVPPGKLAATIRDLVQ